MRAFTRFIFGGVALIGALVQPASGATLVLEAYDPTPGTNDVYNFAGGVNDDANIASGADQNTYVAPDRPTQGQTFSTLTTAPGGFYLTDIYIRHCGYQATASSGNGTWWDFASGAVYTLRITDPAKNGTSGFVISSETYTSKGNEAGGTRWGRTTSGGGNALGDDYWLHFTLATPIDVKTNTLYGIDLTATTASGGNYFEWLGNKTNVLDTGTAYTGTTGGTPGNTVNLVTGDRVFLVHMIAKDEPLPPQTPVLEATSRFKPVGQTALVTVTIPSVVNESNTVTMDLSSDDASKVAFSATGDSTKTLTFTAGATNKQTFTAYILADGSTTLRVAASTVFNEASIILGASLSVVEQFDYDLTAQPYLDQANGGTGWLDAWSQSSYVSTNLAGLTYVTNNGATSLSVIGNATMVSGNGNEAFRSLPTLFGGVGGGTVYVSFLAQAPDGIPDWGGFSLFSGASEQLFMGLVNGLSANDTWGFLRGGSTYMNFAGSVTPTNRTDFLVYRLDFPPTNSGSVTVSLYVNPPLSGTEPYSATGVGTVSNFEFDRVRMGTAGLVEFDEIRIGTSWTNVVKWTGEPMSPGLVSPTLSAPASFLPTGQGTLITAILPTNAPRPITMVITNSNPSAFSLGASNASQTTLTFAAGSGSEQTFTVNVLGRGSATLTVVSNAFLNGTTLALASQVSASESFAYDAGTDNLPGSLGGNGFDVNAWTGGGSVATPGLEFAPLASTGNSAAILGSGSGNAGRTLALSAGSTQYGGVNGGTVWVSFLTQGAFPETQQWAGVSLMSGTAERFLMGLTTAEPNNGKFGFRGTGAGQNASFDNSVIPSVNTTLLVYRLDFPSDPSGLVHVALYANPAVGATPPVTPAGEGDVYNFTFNAVRLGTDFSMAYDEIRIGGSWSEVVPIGVNLKVTPVPENQVRITWPAAAGASWALMSSTNASGPWSASGLTVTTSGGNYTATDGTGGTAKFYRLQQ